MASPYSEFNKHVKEFLRELEKSFDIWCFSFMIAGYKMLKSVHKSLPHKYFQEYVYIPHASSIRNHCDKSMLEYQPPILYANLVQALQEVWKQQTQETKDTIWAHLDVLIVLNERCIEYRRNKNMPPIETVEDTACDD